MAAPPSMAALTFPPLHQSFLHQVAAPISQTALPSMATPIPSIGTSLPLPSSPMLHVAALNPSPFQFTAAISPNVVPMAPLSNSKGAVLATWLELHMQRYFAQKEATSTDDEIHCGLRFRLLRRQVTSRTVHIPWDNAGALCPIGDLFNYTPPHAASTETKPNVSNGTKNAYPSDMDEAAPWDCHDAQSSTKLSNESGTDVQFQSGLTDGEYVSRFSSYCFYAHEDYKAGDQVLLCYGSYNSLELLEHYGFLLQYNPNDEVYVTLPQLQDFVLRSLGLLPMSSGPNAGCYIQVDGRPSFSLLRALRLHFVSSDLCRSRGYLAAYGMQITVESDLAAYDWLLHRCKEMIASFPTTLVGDAILHEFIRTCCLHDNLEKLAAGASWENFQDSISSPSSVSRKEQQDILDEMDSFLLFHDSYFRKRSKYQARLWLERWGLSVEWRLSYKRILHRCVDFCLEQLKCLITI